jgi:hypothetical protein
MEDEALRALRFDDFIGECVGHGHMPHPDPQGIGHRMPARLAAAGLYVALDANESFDLASHCPILAVTPLQYRGPKLRKR